MRSRNRRIVDDTATTLKFMNDLPMELNPNEEVIQKCPQCDYEIKIFNDDFLLSWQMHVQENYHIVGSDNMKKSKIEPYKQLLKSEIEKKAKRKAQKQKPENQANTRRERRRQRQRKNVNKENNKSEEKRKDQEFVDREENSSDEYEDISEDENTSNDETEDKEKKHNEHLNDQNANEKAGIIVISRRRKGQKRKNQIINESKKSVAKKKQSTREINKAMKEDEAYKYINLTIPSLRSKNVLQNIYDMFPNVEMINNWGHEQEMKSQKQMLMTAKLDVVQKAIENAFRLVYKGNFTIKLFGSRITGLATENTNDIDVFIDTGDTLLDENKQVRLLKRLSDKMKHSETMQKDWNSVVAILETRTPIIKAKYKVLQMSCDISMKNGLPVVNTGLLKVLFMRLPIMKQLILILRKWLKEYFGDTFTNYALAMMVLFYFQNEKILPSVLKMADMSDNLRSENGWIVCDYEKISQFHQPILGHESMSLVEHLYKFFKFYTTFDFDKEVVCPFLGYAVRKSDFNDYGEKLPLGLDNYVTLVQTELCEEFRYESAMCVQDPIELCHNLTKAVKRRKVFQFQVMCEISQFALADLCTH